MCPPIHFGMSIPWLRKVYFISIFCFLWSPLLEEVVRQNASFLYLYQPLKQLLMPISNSLESLAIDAYTGNSKTFSSLEIQNLPRLCAISISSWSFVYVTLVTCKNNPQLKHISIKDHCFCQFHKSTEKTAFCVHYCEGLQAIAIGKESFRFYRSIRIEGCCESPS